MRMSSLSASERSVISISASRRLDGAHLYPRVSTMLKTALKSPRTCSKLTLMESRSVVKKPKSTSSVGRLDLRQDSSSNWPNVGLQS